MNYLDIKHCNMVNGDGLRTVIWVSGCERKCKGCFSPYTHDFNVGIPFTKKAKNELFEDSKYDWCSGITLLGGEPLHPKNVETMIEVSKEYKELFPNKTIWVYSGYTLEEIKANPIQSEILKYIDVLCDGAFIESLKDVDLKWVGSSNQRILYKGKDF